MSRRRRPLRGVGGPPQGWWSRAKGCRLRRRSTPMARKTYTREFKLQAVRLMVEQGLSVSEVARQLGVGENCLRVWRAAAKDRGGDAFAGPGNLSAEQQELCRLRAEVARLRAERDLLKKAAAYFASPPS